MAMFSATLARAQVAAPEAVEAVAIGPTKVHIFWNAVSGAEGYAILRDGVRIATVGASTVEYTDATAEPNRNYLYSVAALDAHGVATEGRPYLERTFPVLPAETPCDLLVIGATTGGVAATVVAGRYGLNVVLIEETRRLGGMTVNGLGASDIRRLEDSSGFFEEFRRRVRAYYGGGNGLKYEPRVAHQVMKEILWSVPGVRVYRQVRPIGVKARARRIIEVAAEEVETGRKVVFRPQLVIDATECGDVAAWAGAPFRVGREPRSRREPHAGHIYYDRANDRILPGSTGQGDHRVQAYAYLMTVKDFGPNADKTIPKPPGYDASKYEHAPPWSQSWNATSGVLPNNKFEINQHPHGSDLQGINYGYPTASYAERRRLEKLFKDHALGYLYYIQTVQGKKNLGLSEDDYRDSDGWPTSLYVREARRFEGDVMMDQTDIMDARQFERPNAIGIGDYAMDSHATQPKTDWTTPDLGEGEFYLPQYTPWHQIPYPIMIPRKVENLFVPTAVSATHVAYGTYRMEPVRMHFGTAAGVAAVLCLRYRMTPREVPVNRVQEELLKRHAGTPEFLASDGIGGRGPTAYPTLLYKFADVDFDTPKFRAIQWLGARGFYPCPAPEKRTPTSGLMAAPFGPNASLTVGEARRLLGMLDRRRSAASDLEKGKKHVNIASTLIPSPLLSPREKGRLKRRGSPSLWEGEEPGVRVEPHYSGSPGLGMLSSRCQEPERTLQTQDTHILTRALAAEWLVRFMGWTAPTGASHYADIEPGTPLHQAAEALYATWIDSRLWDGEKALAPEGKLYFRPDTPITRAQFAEMLYFASAHIDPPWQDNPIDTQPILRLTDPLP